MINKKEYIFINRWCPFLPRYAMTTKENFTFARAWEMWPYPRMHTQDNPFFEWVLPLRRRYSQPIGSTTDREINMPKTMHAWFLPSYRVVFLIYLSECLSAFLIADVSSIHRTVLINNFIKILKLRFNELDYQTSFNGVGSPCEFHISGFVSN